MTEQCYLRHGKLIKPLMTLFNKDSPPDDPTTASRREKDVSKEEIRFL